METPKISEVTKALRKAKFTKLDGEAVFGPHIANTYYKYKGSLYINAGENIGFCILSAKDAKIFGRYSTCVTNAKGQSFEVSTDWPDFFFPNLFGYLDKSVSEEKIIAQVSNPN